MVDDCTSVDEACTVALKLLGGGHIVRVYTGIENEATNEMEFIYGFALYRFVGEEKQRKRQKSAVVESVGERKRV